MAQAALRMGDAGGSDPAGGVAAGAAGAWASLVVSFLLGGSGTPLSIDTWCRRRPRGRHVREDRERAARGRTYSTSIFTKSPSSFSSLSRAFDDEERGPPNPMIPPAIRKRSCHQEEARRRVGGAAAAVAAELEAAASRRRA